VLRSRSFVCVTSALAVRVLRLAVLEREDAGVLDDAEEKKQAEYFLTVS